MAEWEWLEIPKASGTAEINESTEQMYEFGAREGVPRLLNMFNKFVCSLARRGSMTDIQT